MSESVQTATLRRLFEGLPVTTCADGSPYAVMSVTDFSPPMLPQDGLVLAQMLEGAFTSWEGTAALIGIANRSSGPLTHGVSLLRQLPYSLANWYPDGSVGDILVERTGGFTGGDGMVFLNGLSTGSSVVYCDDCLRRGVTSATLIRAAIKAGIKVAAALFCCEIEGFGGRAMLEQEFPGLKVVTLATIAFDNQKTAIRRMHISRESQLKRFKVPTIKEVKQLPNEIISKKFKRVLDSFVGIKIYRAKGSTYPYCNFSLTDFIPLLDPTLVEDMADCIVYVGEFQNVDILVSEGDRGGGPLILAVAARTNLPFTLASWTSSGTDVGVASDATVGYSGVGKIFLNGVKKGSRCHFVDDMLSSGGTAEALFKGIEAAGGIIAGASFASEKTNTGGRRRLGQQWPNAEMKSIAFFCAEGEATSAHSPLQGSNETPIQKYACQNTSKIGTALHYGSLFLVALGWFAKP